MVNVLSIIGPTTTFVNETGYVLKTDNIHPKRSQIGIGKVFNLRHGLIMDDLKYDPNIQLKISVEVDGCRFTLSLPLKSILHLDEIHFRKTTDGAPAGCTHFLKFQRIGVGSSGFAAFLKFQKSVIDPVGVVARLAGADEDRTAPVSVIVEPNNFATNQQSLGQLFAVDQGSSVCEDGQMSAIGTGGGKSNDKGKEIAPDWDRIEENDGSIPRNYPQTTLSTTPGAATPSVSTSPVSVLGPTNVTDPQTPSVGARGGKSISKGKKIAPDKSPPKGSQSSSSLSINQPTVPSSNEPTDEIVVPPPNESI